MENVSQCLLQSVWRCPPLCVRGERAQAGERVVARALAWLGLAFGVVKASDMSVTRHTHPGVKDVLWIGAMREITDQVQTHEESKMPVTTNRILFTAPLPYYNALGVAAIAIASCILRLYIVGSDSDSFQLPVCTKELLAAAHSLLAPTTDRCSPPSFLWWPPPTLPSLPFSLPSIFPLLFSLPSPKSSLHQFVSP